MSQPHQPRISIVTPVYNDAEYLAECIESILGQSYQNWDYTIVDNCSSDGSSEIAKKYAAKEPRVSVHDNAQFLRAVPNFNSALRLISPTSKYCKIVFADDWIYPDCLAQMAAVAEEHPSVGIVGAYGIQGSEVMWSGLPYPSKFVSGREICRKLFLDDLYVFGTGTSLLFRADLVRGRTPFYDEGNLHADSEACIALLRECDFGFVHQVLTFTRERPGSLTEFSKSRNTLIAGRIHDLVTHGQEFLSPEEFKFCVRRKADEYYQFLAHSLVRGRNQEFWDYHKRKLTEAGVGFSRIRLWRAVVQRFLNLALNPKLAFERHVSGKAQS